jgi:serine protease Do
MKATPKFHRMIFFLVTALVLISCALSGGSDTGEEAQADTPEAPATAPADSGGSTLVTSLSDVKRAVIQIEAVGTFVDPEIGEYSGAGFGSGFIIDPSGLAITNNHVVTGAALIEVWVGGDTTKTYNARIIAVSECSDLALIDIEGDGFPYLEWYSDPVTVGLEVYAAGFPLGDPEFTLTKGIVSKEKADGESSWSSVNQVIEHDATINPGNSGGPLVTEDGQVVGINYASYAAAGQFFAIGRDTTQQILEQLKKGNDVDSLGINGVAVSNEDGSLSGIWVTSVKSGSTADESGLEPGDLITNLEGLPLADDGTMSAYCDIIRTQGDQSTLSMRVLRFDTDEILEGQFNGRALAVVEGAGYGETNENAGPSPAGVAGVGADAYSEQYILEVFDDGYMAVTDDYSALYVEVPTSWNQVNGAIWQEYWGDLYFEAANVIAAPDIDAFLNTYYGSGMSFAASKDWGNIGGYIGLLDGTKHWFEDDCDYQWREDYEDPVYEGAYDFWECGRDAGYVVLSVRPIADPTAYLALVEVQVLSDADIDAMERILDTFDLVDGYLP